MPPYHFTPLRQQKPNLVQQIPAQAYRCGSPSSASAASCFLISSRLIFNKNPHSGQFSWRTNANPPPFVSNSVRHFVVLVIQLHLCSSIPSLRAEQRRQAGRQAGSRLRTTGEVTPGSASVIFDRGPEKRAGQLSQ